MLFWFGFLMLWHVVLKTYMLHVLNQGCSDVLGCTIARVTLESFTFDF